MARRSDDIGGVPPRPDLPDRPDPTDLLVGRLTRLSFPIWGIFWILMIHALIFASELLVPITASILGYFLLNAPRRWLARLGVPDAVSAAFFAILLVAALFLGGLALADPMYAFVTDIPVLLQEGLASLQGPGGFLEPFSRAADATEAAMREAQSARGEAAPLAVEVVNEGQGLGGSVVSLAPGLLSQLVLSVVLLYFLVASGDLFIQKAVQAADRFEDKRNTLTTIRMIEARLGNYLGAITLINAGLGLVIGLAMWVWGMPTPVMIGAMAMALNFVPFVGAVVGALVVAVIAFVEWGSLWTALLICATYYALTAIEGQLVTPTLVGQRLRLNVVAVFLAVAFFAWIWSVMGMVVAVPMLIVVKVVCDSVPRLRRIGLFLGDAEGFVQTDEIDRLSTETRAGLG
ncbi:AI-2E family transporter [Jannaschia seohaensis]|uniref:Predicted PurR-regulated permease PerM n=1 Tax=Jannaschia seohaensis TaxID=475081 RepID=A0A2Y9B4Z4_9RHOB|nr:AI-2E family transporter [Jannaschia seohaensis]PWJ13252.1 putative PurR-regulated permease PerM [Jannaschia seohaensis]SSA50578.1 Predicted PurR-regulated permease PerM [Jannaschia seohaensis]